MPGPLHVLLYGDLDAGVCEAYRFGALAGPLAGQGIELRTWESMAPYRLFVPSELTRDLDRAIREGRAEIDLSPLAWADVLVMRRWYATAHACADCDTVTRRAEQLLIHARSRGHRPSERGLHTRVLLDRLARDPAVLDGTALLYETDDDLLDPDGPPGIAARLAAERPDVRRMLALADLVTTTTPVLAGRLAPHTRAEVRVVRNALDPAWYAPAPAAPSAGADDPGLRVVYHGPASRLADYALARPAVDALAAGDPSVRRLWLGSDDPVVAAAVDEARPWTAGVPAFAAALAAARPGIGLAPLADTAYNRARSELHWLEYALAGAPAVVSGFDGPGPYDAVRDGVDGLVARTPADWQRGLAALAASPAYRAELAAAARERVLARYTVAVRAPEWAAAYADAAARAGMGRA